MKFPSVFFVAGIFVASVNAQMSTTQVAVNALRKSHPAAKWKSKSAIVADVTCDGKLDTVILGLEKNNVVVGMVSSAYPNKTQVLSFPVTDGTQDGFCAFPTRIEISPLDCKSDSGAALPGCQPVKACQAFAVIDNECDPFNFYWDASRGTLAWWRN